MTHEHFSPHSPDPSSLEHATDTSGQSGNFTNDRDTFTDNLHRAASELGPAGVHDYLKALLASTESHHKAERAAAFDTLAERQLRYTSEKVLRSGLDTVSELSAGNRLAEENTANAHQHVNRILDEREQSLRGQASTPTARAAQEETVRQTTKASLHTLDEFHHDVNRWKGMQYSVATGFNGALKHLDGKEATLSEAQVSLQSDQEPIDVSRLIDDDVISQFAREFHAEKQADAKGDKDAEPVSLAALKDMIASVKDFVDTYTRSLSNIDSSTSFVPFLHRDLGPLTPTDIGQMRTIPQHFKAIIRQHTTLVQTFEQTDGSKARTLETRSRMAAQTNMLDVMQIPAGSSEIQEQPIAKPTQPQKPDYKSVAGTKEYIGPEPLDTPPQQPDDKSTASSVDAREPQLPAPLHGEGFTQSSPLRQKHPRYTAPSTIDKQPTEKMKEAEQPDNQPKIFKGVMPPKIHRPDASSSQPAQRRPHPNSFPIPTDTRPDWIKNIDRVNGRD
jgi:hypothetical protein